MRSKLYIVLIYFVSFSLLPRNVYSDDLLDLSFEELMAIKISSTSFFETSVAESPGYVQVFDLGKLELGAYYTLSDILEHYAVGSSIGSHPRQGALHGVRGVLIDNSAKTPLMVNGQQINPRSHFGSSLSLNSPFLGDMQRVEVINGPGAIIHGSGAINGFINLIPKNGEDHEGGFATVTYGHKDQLKKLESGYGINYGSKKNVYIYGGVIGADGFEADKGYGLDDAAYGDYETKAWEEDNFRLSTFWNHENFSLQAFYQELNSSSQTSTEFSSGGPQLHYPFHTSALGLQPKLIIELTDTESLEIVESFFWHEHSYPNTGTPTGGREMHWENKAIFRTTRFEDHSIAVGGLYGLKEFDAGNQFFNSDVSGPFESVDTEWQEYSLFFEDTWTVTEKLTLSMALRYDKYKMDEVTTNGISYTPEDEDQWSPRITLAYQINDFHNIKLSYQHGFRMPDASYYDWFTQNNNAAEALDYQTATLEPESMDSYELNYMWDVTQKLSLGVNLFYNEYKDQLAWGNLQNIWSDSQVTDINTYNGVTWGGGQFQNSMDESQSYGGEFIVNYYLLENVHTSLSYGYTKLADVDVQKYPSHQIKWNTSAQFLNNKLTLGFNYLFNSSYQDGQTPGHDDIYGDQRHLVDIFTSYKNSREFDCPF